MWNKNIGLNKIIFSGRIVEWSSEWLLFNAKWVSSQLYHGEDKLHFNKMMMSTFVLKMRWFESGYQLLYDRYLLHMISTHFIIVSTLIWNMVCMHHPTHHCINMTNLATSVVYCCCCFSACSTKEKEHWLVWNLGNVSDWGNMSTSRLLFQWANTMKIKLNVLV
jgi:hypothetical protein